MNFKIYFTSTIILKTTYFNCSMSVKRYDPLQSNHIAGMILVTADGIFEGPQPQDAFSKAMDYKIKLAKYFPKVIQTLTDYLSTFSKEDKEFFEKISGIEMGTSPSLISDEESTKNMKLMNSLAKIEKQKG